jgi:hypothetical protein
MVTFSMSSCSMDEEELPTEVRSSDGEIDDPVEPDRDDN